MSKESGVSDESVSDTVGKRVTHGHPADAANGESPAERLGLSASAPSCLLYLDSHEAGEDGRERIALVGVARVEVADSRNDAPADCETARCQSVSRKPGAAAGQ